MSRWSEFLAAYNYRLIHRPGKLIPHADALSRAPLPEPDTDPAPTTTTLNIETAPNLPLTASDIAHATSRDKRLAQVLQWVQKGWPERDNFNGEFKSYRTRQTELSSLKGCLLWGDRVVIPESLQRRVLQMLHEAHPGIVRTKALARSYAWWPGMDKDIEAWVASCQTCQRSQPNPPTAPVRDWETPRGPWSRLHLDFAGPTKGHTFLITVDAYSNWLEVSNMKSTTTEAVTKVLSKLFATHGLPDLIVTDNGPQFTSLDFEHFLASHCIRHALTAPAHPAANGRAERMVQFTKKTIQKLETGDIQDKINRMLFIQHITPNTTTNRSPAELLMGRKLRSPFDRLHPTYTPERPPDSSSKTRTFTVGEPVYARNLIGDPLWVPATITQVTGPLSYRLQTSDGRSWKRHINQLRARHHPGNITDPDPLPRAETWGGRGDPNHNQNMDRLNRRHCPIGRERSRQYSPGEAMPDSPAETSPGRSSQASSNNPRNPGSSRASSASSPSRLSGSDGEQPASPSQENPVGSQDPIEGSSDSDNCPTQSNLRRSSRKTRSPAYLKDYVT